MVAPAFANSNFTGFYPSATGSQILNNTTLNCLFSDDFGGSAISSANWDVLDGGLAANVDLGYGVLNQAAIGSGTTGMTDAVAASGLTVNMNTTSGAERWYLSKQAFAGKEDILVLLSRSQALAANSVFIGLVEVDPTTFIPLLNPNFANEFTNRGGVEFGLTTTSTAYQAEAIGDSSSAKAMGAAGVAGAALTTTQEYLIEIDSRDITVSNALVDSVAAKAAGASRVSSQCPNDKKLYKLVMRFKNVSAPGSNTSIVVQRILVVDNYEQRVQVSTGEGDQIGSKAIAVNVIGTPAITFTSVSTVTNNGNFDHKLISAATTNATVVKAAAGKINFGALTNTAAAFKFFKLYNKPTSPVVGTDIPVGIIGIPPSSTIGLDQILGIFGAYCTSGVAYAITGASADSDTTAVAAGDVIVSLNFG